MQLSKNQRFGLITFIVLIIAAYLVTVEPWKKSSRDLQTSMVPEGPPANINIQWSDLTPGYPLTSTTDTIRSYTGFDLGYSEQYEQASWVVYVITKEEIESGHVERTDNFRADASISTGSSELKDYRGSGFDRGVWKRLEEQVRDWAVEKDSLFVITGPVLGTMNTFIGENEVGVPGSYFKVLVDLSPPDHSFIAFLLPNAGSSDDLHQFAISVDSLEQVTGYDFFAAAPDQEVIDWLESQLDLGSWN